MKRLVNLLLVLFLALSMCACGTSDNSTDNNTANELTYTAGTYEGEASGMGGTVKVAVTVTETAIEKVEVISHSETPMIGWGVPTAPVEAIPTQIIEHQSLAIDTVTGATITSYAVLNATKAALSESGVDVKVLEAKAIETQKQEDETLEADVVIAGAGGAGLMAAVEAASNGASVIVVEKAGSLTGNSTRNGGLLMAAGTNYTDVTVEELEDYIVNQIGEGKVDATRIHNYIENSGELLEYFISLGTVIDCVSNIWDGVVDLPVVYMTNSVNENNEVEIRPGFNTSLGAFYMQPLYEEAIELGVQVLFNTPMTEILVDGNQKATGLLCERKDGSKVTVNASAVIIATGGYAGSNELLKENTTMLEGDFVSYAANTDTGDGIWAAEAIGADIRYEKDMTTMSPTANSVLGNITSSLIVTPAGERFTREYDYFFSVEHDLNREGYSVCYEIIDDSFADEFFKPAIEAAKNNTASDIITASSVKELAEKLGMDEATLQSTLDRYNELCVNGNDEDYGKYPEHMQEIKTDGSAMLIALKRRPTICDTYGGINTDSEGRVLNTEGNAIEGLYAAGTTAFTNWVHYEYPGCGYGFGVSVFAGSTAGLTALTDLKFESVQSVFQK